MQNRVLRTLALDGVPVFHPSSTRFWTPHSGRTFLSWEDGVLRRATACNDQSSLRCKASRLIPLPKTNQSVTLTLSWKLKAWMRLEDLSVSSHWIQLNWSNHSTDSRKSLRNPEEPEDDVVLEDNEEAFHAAQPTSKRRKSNSEVRTATLGENPKEGRAGQRSHSVPTGIWLLHACQARRRSEHSVSWASAFLSSRTSADHHLQLYLPSMRSRGSQRWWRLIVYGVVLEYVR